jgi:uncharacterized membrane protein YeaQ/YmgE (transglycosylase-associated protein family)
MISDMQRWARRSDIVPDIVALIIWLIAGIVGGFAVGDLFKRIFDLGPAESAVAGAVGGVVGAEILQLLSPALSGFDIVPLVGQMIGAVVSGAALTVVTGAVRRLRQRR